MKLTARLPYTVLTMATPQEMIELATKLQFCRNLVVETETGISITCFTNTATLDTVIELTLGLGHSYEIVLKTVQEAIRLVDLAYGNDAVLPL